MLKKIIFALLLGVLCTLFFAQYDAWTHVKIVQLMQKISNQWLGGNFSCTIQSVNFFAPSLVLHDLEMKSVEEDGWWWRCKKCEIHCSWLQLLFKGVMDQFVVMDGFECNSRIKNAHILIESHIMAMMQKSFLPFPVELKSMIFKNASFCAIDEQYKSELLLSFNSSSLRVANHIKTTMSIGNGHVMREKSTYIENIVTDIFVTTEYSNDMYDIGAQVAGTCVLSHMGNQGGCYVTGGWKSDRGRFAVRNAYNSFTIDPIIITERELRVNARFPLSYLVKCFADSSINQMIDGMTHCSLKMSRDEQLNIDGHIVVEDVTVNNHYVCDTGKIMFGGHGNDWQIHFGISRYNQECKGTGYWQQSTHKGEFAFKNATEFSTKSLPYWRIKPHNLSAQIIVDQDQVTAHYDVVTTHTLSDVMHKSNGIISCNQDIFAIQGLIDENQFSVEGALYPYFLLHRCMYKDKDNLPLMTLQAAEDGKFLGSIAFPFIRSLLNSTLKYDVQGEGDVDVVATVSPTEVVADIALKDATIRLPQTYNFINGFNAHCVYDIAKRAALFENVNVSLHTGTIHCLRTTMHFDQQGSLIFMHAPCIVDNCLLNIKKDLFATISGNFLFSKIGLTPTHLDGHIIIDKAQLKENLFSSIIQKQLLSYTHLAFSVPDIPLQYNVAIETKYPIAVDTGVLQTNAHVNVRVYKDGQEPTVAGSVVLQGGTLNFPYKPLYISKGVITFLPEQLFDPIIELVARNKIKKYDVSLIVEGSLINHHIALDATPPLSEEQVVGLLLVGAEEHSLNSMMPALIVQNLKSLIFSHNQSSFFEKYFKPLLGSFNINLVPSFTDQTGRGGLRGALEISLDDRWRATIQKNFSLTEDTKFELEFLLSDDITLRAIRDERRDLGGEVEMRWKF